MFAFHVNLALLTDDLWKYRGGFSATAAEVSIFHAYGLAGHTGVTLFFVISGFLLSRPFLAEAGGGERVDRRRYFRRRVLRIMPLYIVGVAVASIVCARQPVHLLRGLPYLLFLNSFSGTVIRLWPHSDVWWSLATEVQFYLLLPLLPLVLRQRWRWVGVISIYIVAYLLLAAGVFSFSTSNGQALLWQSIFGRGPLFALGIGLAWIYDRHRQALRTSGKGSSLLRGEGRT